MAASRRVVAQVERLAADADPDLAWQPVGDEVLLDVDVTQGRDDVRWSGIVLIPTKPSGTQQRIALKEYEMLESDASEADATLSHGAGSEFPRFSPVRYRLVYADHLTL